MARGALRSPCAAAPGLERRAHALKPTTSMPEGLRKSRREAPPAASSASSICLGIS